LVACARGDGCVFKRRTYALWGFDDVRQPSSFDLELVDEFAAPLPLPHVESSVSGGV
jgi:hypothetical protein